MKFNFEEWNYDGPFMYNKPLKKYILKHGIPLKQMEFIEDKDDPTYSKNISILHIPSGKVNLNYTYFNKDKHLMISNAICGIYPGIITTNYDDYIGVYNNKDTRQYSNLYKDFNKKKYNKKMQKLINKGIYDDDIKLKKLKKLYKKSNIKENI